MKSRSAAFDEICDWSNLLQAWRRAAQGKRGHASVAGFEHQIADHLLELRSVLREDRYQPGRYTHFFIHEPKLRKISAAPFRDRVVHHALCAVIEPRFEQLFIPDSYANRIGKGTHRAVDRLQQFARSYRYALRMDIVKHFPAIDHQILQRTLARHIAEDDVMALVARIIASGDGVLDAEYTPPLFPGDDLLAACRPRGLPIGNLTSQFWSNCYLNPFDFFVTRELRCRAYLRFVDDFTLFSNSKRELWAWKQAIIERLATLRLCVYESAAQVTPSAGGIPWLGFVIYPDHRRVKARNVRNASRRLGDRLDAYFAGTIGFAEFDASVRGWVNHVRYADTWGLRRHVFGNLQRKYRAASRLKKSAKQ